jgi:hypothetical protein
MKKKTTALFLIVSLAWGLVGVGSAAAGAGILPAWSAAVVPAYGGRAEFCRKRCQDRCSRFCQYRHHCRPGPQHCYRGTTCYRGVCRDNQTICQPGPMVCPGGGDCYGDCKRRCEWRCRRR